MADTTPDLLDESPRHLLVVDTRLSSVAEDNYPPGAVDPPLAHDDRQYKFFNPVNSQYVGTL